MHGKSQMFCTSFRNNAFYIRCTHYIVLTHIALVYVITTNLDWTDKTYAYNLTDLIIIQTYTI